jgi:hypothetical protein
MNECVQALCAMLEVDAVDDAAADSEQISRSPHNDDMRVQMITALQSTPVGRRHYAQLCERQSALMELVCLTKSCDILNVYTL